MEFCTKRRLERSYLNELLEMEMLRKCESQVENVWLA